VAREAFGGILGIAPMAPLSGTPRRRCHRSVSNAPDRAASVRTPWVPT